MSESMGDFWIRKIGDFRKGRIKECPVCERVPAPATPATTPMAAREEALAKFKGLAKEFRREASHWKKLDTSIAEARQEAFNECASDIEAAVKALEHGQQYDGVNYWTKNGKVNIVTVSADEPQRESEQPEALREALKSSMIALDDWLNIHAPDLCDEQRVKEARQRVNERGTIHYICAVQDRNRAALSPRSEQPEQARREALEEAAVEVLKWSEFDDSTTQKSILCQKITRLIAESIRALADTSPNDATKAALSPQTDSKEPR